MSGPQLKPARGAAPLLPRGRIARWSREQLDKLSTPELRALLVNAQRLHEPEVAAMCSELLDARPYGHTAAHRRERAAEARRLVARRKAFELQVDDVRAEGAKRSCLLWAPTAADSGSEAGKERLERCRSALARGSAHGLLLHGIEGRADAANVFELQIELRGDEYWASWTAA